MQVLLNIRFSFLCRTTRTNKEGKCPIILRISFRHERRDIFTGLYCQPENWDGQTNKVLRSDKLAVVINQNLDVIIRKANDAFDALKFSNEPFTIDELVDKIKGNEERPTSLIDFLEQADRELKESVGTRIVLITYRKYKQNLEHLRKFLQLQYRVKNYSLQRIDGNFIKRYYDYLRKEGVMAHNSAHKLLTCLKTVLKPAIKAGTLRDPFDGLNIRVKQVLKEYLTQEEIDAIADYQIDDLSQSMKRDIFIFACYTGLSYVDLKQMNRTHIINDGINSWHIRKPRQKTGQESIIPLLPAAIRILQKYSPTKIFLDFNWQVFSNQKMNKALKTLGHSLGFEKELHMHLARHTFATTVTLLNGVPIETVSRMLGHANIKQTQHYAKVIPLKIKIDMKKIKSLYQ